MRIDSTRSPVREIAETVVGAAGRSETRVVNAGGDAAGRAMSRAFATRFRDCRPWGGSRSAVRPQRSVTRSSGFSLMAFDLG
jgi:hypothetical protein